MASSNFYILKLSIIPLISLASVHDITFC